MPRPHDDALSQATPTIHLQSNTAAKWRPDRVQDDTRLGTAGRQLVGCCLLGLHRACIQPHRSTLPSRAPPLAALDSLVAGGLADRGGGFNCGRNTKIRGLGRATCRVDWLCLANPRGTRAVVGTSFLWTRTCTTTRASTSSAGCMGTPTGNVIHPAIFQCVSLFASECPVLCIGGSTAEQQGIAAGSGHGIDARPTGAHALHAPTSCIPHSDTTATQHQAQCGASAPVPGLELALGCSLKRVLRVSAIH